MIHNFNSLGAHNLSSFFQLPPRFYFVWFLNNSNDIWKVINHLSCNMHMASENCLLISSWLWIKSCHRAFFLFQNFLKWDIKIQMQKYLTQSQLVRARKSNLFWCSVFHERSCYLDLNSVKKDSNDFIKW